MTPRRRPLPADARRLIEHNVHSVGVLDLLLLAREEPERWWTPGEISEHLHCPVRWASTELGNLRAGGLLEADGDRGYRFRPRDLRLAQAVEALAAAYTEQTRDVVGFIFSAESARRAGGRRSRRRP